MTAKRGQVASLDLILSVVAFFLFIALIIAYILTIIPSQTVRYGEGLIERIDFVDDRVLDRSAIPDDPHADQLRDFGRSIFTYSDYSEESAYCITLDSSAERESLIGDACRGSATPECPEQSRGIDRYAHNVLDENMIKQLTLWVCT